MLYFFFFKQKTAYEMRISDWSSDVCSSDLPLPAGGGRPADGARGQLAVALAGQAAEALPYRHWRREGIGQAGGARVAAGPRSEARRVGNEGGSTGQSRWSR